MQLKLEIKMALVGLSPNPTELMKQDIGKEVTLVDVDFGAAVNGYLDPQVLLKPHLKQSKAKV